MNFAFLLQKQKNKRNKRIIYLFLFSLNAWPCCVGYKKFINLKLKQQRNLAIFLYGKIIILC